MERALASYVRSRRQERGLSLRALAKRAGVSKSTLSAWERGVQLPSLPELDALLGVYKVTKHERAELLRLIEAPRARRELQRQTENALGEAPAVSGDLLRALRIRRGVTASGAAHLLGVQPSTVLRWERGDVWPSVERIDAICSAFGAHPAEREALTNAQNVLPAGGEGDLCAIERALFNFRHWHWRGTPMPLVELELVGAIAGLWSRVGRSASAEELYRQANAYLACWAIVAYGALDDAAHYARRALAGDDGTLPLSIVTWPVHVLAKHAATGGRRKRPAEGAAFLSQWAPRYERDLGVMAWLQRDLAEFYGESGDLEAALALSSEACLTTRRAGDPTINADFDHASLLIRAERYEEAIPFLPPERTTVPLQDANETLARVEILIGLGEREEAARRLDEVLAMIARHGLPTVAPKVDTLSSRLLR